MKPRIVYIELKPRGGQNSGPGTIRKVHFSQSGKILYYAGHALEKIREEGGAKANYADIVSGEKYWVSGCKKQGGDRLDPGTIEIDESIREEYWTTIRNMPDCTDQKTIRCTGKHGGKRRASGSAR